MNSTGKDATPEKFKRKIRSYVRREGRVSARQQCAYETLLPIYGVELTGNALNLEELFGRRAATVLEIGFGMGDSLITMAHTHPEMNYLGIEVHKPGVGSVLASINEQNINNIRLFCADAVDVLENRIADNTLDKVQIFFPDPWHKKRHHKRRLIQAPFVRLLADKLKPQGILHIATDWKNYAEHINDVLADCTAFSVIENDSTTARPTTKFESRGIRLGHGVWDLIFQRQ